MSRSRGICGVRQCEKNGFRGLDSLVWSIAAIAAMLALPCGPAESQSSDRRAPRIPQGVRLPPGWALKNLPFPAEEHFAALPPDANAAIPYIDALFEFSDEVEACFTEPAFTSRGNIARSRLRRFNKLYADFLIDPSGLDRRRLEGLLREFRTGFAKLENAQQRSECLFERDIGFGSFRGHAAGLRQLVRIIELKCLLETDPARIEKDIASVLRLSADVRRRCDRAALHDCVITDRHCCLRIIRPALEAHGSNAAWCKRIEDLLRRHDSAIAGSALEALRDDYLKIRKVIVELSEGKFDAARIAAELKLHAERTTTGRIVCLAFVDVGSMPINSRRLQRILADEAARDQDLEETIRRMRADSKLEAKMERTWVGLWLDNAIPAMSEGDFDFEIAALNEWYAAAEQRLKTSGPASREAPEAPTWTKTRILRYFLPPSVDSLWESEAENRAWIGCAIAGAGWRAANAEHDAAATSEGSQILRKIVDSLVDPFDGTPLKSCMGDHGPIVYSVGPDRKDDGGRREWNGSHDDKGDIVYPLPRTSRH